MASNIMTDAARKSQWDASSYSAINYATDTLQFMLQQTGSDAISDANKQTVVFEDTATYGPVISGNEITGTGYTARGMAPGGQSVTQSSHSVKVTCTNPSWSSATFTAYGVWMVKHLSTSGTSPALFYYTFGGAVTATSGTFQIAVNAAGLFTVSGG